ncbi:formylglycine-generating enzyme family protein [Colwellia sp. BRX10-3]|nr:formylglycine-generating enzyme family protein [Colwellia sp. BRX10-3]
MALHTSVSNATLADKSAAPMLYQTIKVPKGRYTLYIPDNNFFKLGYYEKEVVFESAVYIGKFEVSNSLWNLCFTLKGCNRPATIRAGETLDSPVVRVNWHDAYQFSKWYSSYTGKAYRLPTEEEWVYAAYMGKDHRNLEILYDYSSLEKIRRISKKTMPLGSFKENYWGLADFQGNVWEWTLTCWYASKANKLKPQTVAAINSPDACTTRIVQGENRAHIPDFINDTYNGGCATLQPAANLGFRLVLEEKK